jgi:hypothetical protein
MFHLFAPTLELAIERAAEDHAYFEPLYPGETKAGPATRAGAEGRFPVAAVAWKKTVGKRWATIGGRLMPTGAQISSISPVTSEPEGAYTIAKASRQGQARPRRTDLPPGARYRVPLPGLRGPLGSSHARVIQCAGNAIGSVDVRGITRGEALRSHNNERAFVAYRRHRRRSWQ